MRRNDRRRNDSQDRSLSREPTRVIGAIRVLRDVLNLHEGCDRPRAWPIRDLSVLTKYLKASNSFDYFVAERVQMLQHRHLCSLSIIHDQRINELQVFRPS